MRLSLQKSITARLTLLFASASSTVLLLLGFLIGASVEQHFEEQDIEVLEGKLKLAQHAIEKAQAKKDLDAIPQQLDESLVGHRGLAVVVQMPGAEPLFATSGAEFPQVLLDSHVRDKPSRPVVWNTQTNQPMRGISALAKTGIKDGPPAIVAVATDISHHEHFMETFRATLWSVVALAAVLTGLLGWVAARRGLEPLQAMKKGAAAVTANRLDYRLPVEKFPVELADLARTLNEMLDRLEDSFRRLSDFSADIAHELRTPISNVLTQTQVMLSKPRTSDEYRDVLASNAEEFERLTRMIGEMLLLAKSENDLIAPNKEQIDLAEEVKGLIEFYEALADEKNVGLSSQGDGFATGDKLMLRRAISNLLSNAIRHTPPGGRVTVRIGQSSDGLSRVAVENTGETIHAEHLPRLFDRFYRVDSSRQHHGEGTGLGLAIVRSIMRIHGGDVFVRSERGLTTFELHLPSHKRRTTAQ